MNAQNIDNAVFSLKTDDIPSSMDAEAIQRVHEVAARLNTN